jgi:membrane protease YdiL (CAAX protease family)
MLNSPEKFVAIVIAGALLCFFMYYYIAHSGYLKQFTAKFNTGIQQKLSLFFARKFSGVIFMGILPGILYYSMKGTQAIEFGFTINKFAANLPTILVLSGIIIAILFINQKLNPSFNTLQINAENWTNSLFALNALGWILYLVAYEFLFRGILLFECNEALGFWPAIAINVSLYAAIHMVNGKDQAIGALFFGTIACYLTLTRGTILIPVFMHITLSLTSDWFSVRLQKKKLKPQKEQINILQK